MGFRVYALENWALIYRMGLITGDPGISHTESVSQMLTNTKQHAMYKRCIFFKHDTPCTWKGFLSLIEMSNIGTVSVIWCTLYKGDLIFLWSR